MTPADLAVCVYEKYLTINPIELSEKCGISVICAAWHPITHGEFDKKNKTITLNTNSRKDASEILLHELGHFFIDAYRIPLSRTKEEAFVSQWVTCLTNLENKNPDHL